MTRRWAACLELWGAPERARRTAAQDVLARYGDPQRRYHTVDHLSEVLAALDQAGPAAAGSAVELAAWLHDAVYDARAAPGENEVGSSALARFVLVPLGVPPEVVAETCRLIELTAGHTVGPGDTAGATLVDADLWILGAPAARYRRYAADVRAEYAYLSDSEWQAGRSRVLEDFAGRSRIFITDRAHGSLDGPARANLAWELATLGGRQPKP